MREKALHKSLRQLRDAALGTLWRQWAALGAMTGERKTAQSLIDPEALVLASLSLGDMERRLWDLLRWWAEEGSSLLSVQRIRNLSPAYPETTSARMAEFAYLAHREGGDFRWRPLEGPLSERRGRPGKRVGKRPRLADPAALMLRLRIGLGVSVKTDLLAFLLGLGGMSAGVKTLAEALGYTPRALHRAVDDMAAAKLIDATGETPTAYRVDPRPWAELLGTSGRPARWRDWSPVFACVAHLLGWVEREDPLKATPYLLSSKARDLMERHRAAFTRNRISIPNPDDYPGEAYLQAFEETLERLASWMEENA